MNDPSNSVFQTVSTVADMADVVRQYGRQIQSVARSGYLSMESSPGAADPEHLAYLLVILENLADQMQDEVFSLASRVTKIPADERANARFDARTASDQAKEDSDA